METKMNSQPTGRGKTDHEIDQLVLWALILAVALFFLLPVLIAIILFAVLHYLQKEQYIPYVGIIGVVILLWQGVTGNLLSYLAIFKGLHIPYVADLFDRVLHKSLNMDIHGYLIVFGLSMFFCLVTKLFVKFFWKNPIVSKQEQIRKKKSSPKYQLFRKNRLEFLKKQQLKYRESESNEVFIGYTDFKERVTIPAKDFNYHMLAVGGTGTGKTTLLASIMEGALRSNKPIIFMDGKGERKSMLEFKRFCEEYGKQVYMFSEHDTYTYNPIKHGTPTEIRDKLMNLFEWSEPFYKTFSSRYLQLVVQLIDAAQLTRDMQTVFDLLSVEKVKETFRKCYIEEEIEEEVEKEVEVEIEKEVVNSGKPTTHDPFAALNDKQSTETEKVKEKVKKIVLEKRTVQSLSPELQSLKKKFDQSFSDEDSERNLTGLTNQLGELLESDLGYLFKSSGHEIDLRKITNEDNVVIFSISGNRYRDYIKKLGKIIILDINSLVAYRQEIGSKPTLAIYDEFSAYGNGEIVDIVNKSRSAGFECIISTQTLADIDAVEPYLTNRIISNCNILATGRVNDPDDAEKLANAFSTFNDKEITSQISRKNNLLKLTSEKGTVKDVKAFVVHPDEIKSLAIGEVYLTRKLLEEEPGMNYTRRIYVRNALDREGIKIGAYKRAQDEAEIHQKQAVEG